MNAREIAEKVVKDYQNLSFEEYNTVRPFWIVEAALESYGRERWNAAIDEALKVADTCWDMYDADNWAKHELYHSGKCGCLSRLDKMDAGIKALKDEAQS